MVDEMVGRPLSRSQFVTNKPKIKTMKVRTVLVGPGLQFAFRQHFYIFVILKLLPFFILK
jgi:hypothetical protein